MISPGLKPVVSLSSGFASQLRPLVVIDPSVDDYQYLADGVVDGAEVVILSENQDGVLQITELLQSRSHLPAIDLHIISHGSPGCLYLGNSCLSLETLDRYTAALRSWRVSSLLLYGCHVAAGDAGGEFLERLHGLTGVAIAASNTRTGNAALGGDWDLAIRIGQKNPTLAFQAQTIVEYAGVLENVLRITNSAIATIQNSFDMTGSDLRYEMRLQILGARRRDHWYHPNLIYVAGQGQSGWRIFYDLNSSRFMMRVGTDNTGDPWHSFFHSGSEVFSDPIPLGQWVTFRIDTPFRTNFYIDGAYVGAADRRPGPYADSITFGGHGMAMGSNTHLLVDDVKVTSSGGYGPPTPLVNIDFEAYDPGLDSNPWVDDNVGGAPDLSGNNRYIATPAPDISIITLNRPPTGVSLSNNTVAENSPNGTTVGFLFASDPDPGDSFTYTLLNDAGGRFLASGNQIFVINSSLLNFEANTSHNVLVRVTDRAGAFTDQFLTINLQDVNEAPTNVALSPATVDENVEVDSVVGTLSSTDPDANNTFSYQLVAGTGDGDNTRFEVVGNQLILKESPDFEAQPSYRIRVRTTDQGGLSLERQLTVTVGDRNETPTGITLSTITVDENIAPSANAATLITLDPDASENFTYSLVSGEGDTDNGAFQIVGNQLRFLTAPDYETQSSYRLRVKVVDKDGLAVERPLTLTINDINETPDNLTLSNAELNENIGADTLVGNLSAIDPDANTTLTYRLVDGEGDVDNDAFQIIDNQLRLTANPNYEAHPRYSIRVSVSDGALSVEKQLTITVNDQNDAPTDLSLSSSAIAHGIPANSMIGTFSTSDEDANESFLYDLVSGFGDDDNAAFTLLDNELRLNQSPNFDLKSDYSLRVRTTDRAGASFEKVVRLVVNKDNDAPADLNLSSLSIDENTAVNALVGGLSSVDPNVGNRFTYSLLGGAGSADNGAFAIAGNDLILKTPANFETKSSYSVRIRTTDQAGASFDKAFAIRVNDLNEAPTNLNLSNAIVPENSAPDGRVGTLSSLDPDASNIFTYSLVSGVGDADNGVFAIAADQLFLKVSPNFETKPSYRIRVRTTDQSGASFERNLTVRVADVNEVPTHLNLSGGGVNENVPVNTVAGRLSSVDPDANNRFSYSLVAGEGDTDNAVFAIVGNELQIQTSPDFETKSSYNIRIRTTDQDGLTFERALTLPVRNLNEAPTDFVLSSNKLNEGSAAGTLIGTLRTVDQDAGSTFTYSLVSGTGSTHNGMFAIAGNQLRFQPITTTGLPSTLSVRIRTTDQGGLSFEEPVTLQVNAAPTHILLSNTRVVENVPVNTVVGNLVAIDRDAGDTFTYQLVAGEGDRDNRAFAIANNQLQFRVSPDFERQPTYSLRVQATDQGGATFQKALEVTVADINEPPSSLRLGFSSIPENQIVYVPLIGVDPDARDRNRLKYSLVDGAGGNDNHAFIIQGTNLIPKAPANFEQKSSYAVRVRVQDTEGEFLEQPLTLAIRDVNEAPTSITISGDRIAENGSANAFVASITGSDPDWGDSLTYSLAGSSPDNNAFTIIGNQLFAKAPLDFETQSFYDIWIQASDRNGLVLASPFRINVEDLAETAIPVLTTDNTKASLRLDGVNDYIRIARESTFDLTNAITVEGSFRVDRWTKPWQSLITKGDSAWRVARAGEGSALEFAVGSGGSGRVIQGSKPVDDGSWHHFAAVYDGTLMKLYVDGQLDAEKAVSGPISTNDFEVWLGANAEVPGRNFAGQLDEFRVWNVARSEAEIQASQRRSVDPASPGLVGYWKLNDGSGTTIASSKAGDNNGTLVNSDGRNWTTSSPVMLSGGGSDQPKEDEFATWSQLRSYLDQMYGGTTPIVGRTSGVLESAFSWFESGESNPTTSVTATGEFAPNSIELVSTRNPLRADLSNLLTLMTRMANLSVPVPSVLSRYSTVLPLADGTLSISDLTTAPVYELSAKLKLTDDMASKGSFVSFLKYLLDNVDLTLKTEVNSALTGASVALTAQLEVDKTILNIGGFELALTGGEYTIGVSMLGEPSVDMKASMELRNYDPTQSNEPDLELFGVVTLEPESFSIGVKMGVAEDDDEEDQSNHQSDASKVWKNPFGIPDSELRNIGIRAGGSYAPPWFDNYQIIGDLKFGNYNIKSAFAIDTNDPNKNAISLTVEDPISLLDLYFGPVKSYALKQLADRVEFIRTGLDFLNKIVDLKIQSVDTDRDGDVDPLISAALFPADILGEKIQPGLSINGKLSAWGKEATLSVSGNPFNLEMPSLSGSLKVAGIDLKLIKLSGVSKPDLELSFRLSQEIPTFGGLASNLISGSRPSFRTVATLRGTGRFDLFGQTIAAADFSLSPSRIDIRQFTWRVGAVGLELNYFFFDTLRLSGAGSGQLKLFGRRIAEGSFSLSNGNLSATGQLGLEVAGAGVTVNAQINLGMDSNRIRLNVQAFDRTYELANLSLGSFAQQYRDLGSLMRLIEQRIPGLSTIGSVGRTIGGLVGINGYIANGTVFFDANLNGLLDGNEPFTVTGKDGSFDLSVDLNRFDRNKNQQIDSSEGRYVLIGGINSSTQMPLATPLTAVLTSTARVLTPLTTLIAAMAQQGMDPKLAQTRIKAALGLRSDVDLASFDPLEAIAQNDSKGLAVYGSMTAVQNTIIQTTRFLNGVSDQPLAQLANAPIAAIADQLKSGNPVDLSNTETIQSVVQNALTKAAAADPGIDLTQVSALAATAAQVIALGNRITREQVMSGRPAREVVLDLVRLQSVAAGQTAPELTQLAAGKLTRDEFLAQNTREAILQRAVEAQIKNPLIRTFTQNPRKNLNLTGTSRNDSLAGGLGNDTVTGLAGDDQLFGNGGHDTLQGNQGNDRLLGNDGRDRLLGGDGNDVLIGGSGGDVLTGGAGRDRFVLNVLQPVRDAIADFNVTEDVLQISGLPASFKRGRPLHSAHFQVGQRAIDRSDRVIYNSTSGVLFYDADGVGRSPQMQIAQLSPGLALTAGQIFAG